MNRTKLPIRKRLEIVRQFSGSVDAAVAEEFPGPSVGAGWTGLVQENRPGILIDSIRILIDLDVFLTLRFKVKLTRNPDRFDQDSDRFGLAFDTVRCFPPQLHHLQPISGFQAFFPRISMADRDLAKLAKMNSLKRGTAIQIRPPYTSLINMINTRGDEYPSLSDLDSYNHDNTFHELDGRIEAFNNMPKISHIFYGNSIVENNPKWRDEFVRLTWVGGDWATLFRRPFCKVIDGSSASIRLTDEEEVAYQALISDDGKTDTWTLLEEFSLKKVGLSKASDRACETINNINRPKEGEYGRQKRAKLNKDPRSKPDAPIFLRPHAPVVELGDDMDPPLKVHSFRPNWGFRRSDTVMGSTKHAKDWSYHSITPHNFTDIVTGSDIESIELLDEFEREMKKWKERDENDECILDPSTTSPSSSPVKDAEPSANVEKEDTEKEQGKDGSNMEE
ncbi:hypothetical protein AgCh_000754 [Apium graveolens]